MAKKQVGVSLRKPPPADGISHADADAFVTRSIEKKAPPSRDLVERKEATVFSPSGRELREMTVYLPQDLARRLAMHCLESDRDANKILAEVVEKHLGPDEVAAVVEAVTPWENLRRTVLAVVKNRLVAWAPVRA